MKDERTFLKAIMQRIFLQLMLFKDDQDYLMTPHTRWPDCIKKALIDCI